MTTPLYTRDVGAGQAILMLHAFPLNSRMWEPQLDALAASARLLAPDLPGFGLSPAPTTAPSLDDYARQVIAVLDTLAVSRVVVVGLSMGGYLAFRLLTELGPRLVGLVLADTRATPDTEAGAAARHRLAAEVAAGGVTLRFVTGGDDGLSGLVLEVSDLAAASRGLDVSSGQDVHLDAARAHGVPLTFRAAP
ncbi:MAG: alpha/beta hydrolase [Deltaproteobacteria bacterium]|nr:MAG: alpha/beta hydrolase [Deltaproteobacteria bacterium]